jgi:nucleoside-diphosphate-sugar epimerase
MRNRSKRVLIFGGTGEIGGRIARGSVEAGHETTGVTRGKNTRHRVNTDGVEFISGDKGDEHFLKSVLAKKGFDIVIDTVPNTEHVKLAHKYFGDSIEHYFMCSSTGTYAPLQYLPADESHPWREETPVNFYSHSQRDEYALSLWQEDGFPVTVFRPTNIIGPGRIPLELWGGRNILYFQLMKQDKPVEIPVAGNVLVQSGHNDDLANAFVKGITKGDEISGEIFIISCKRAITFDQYFNTAKEVLGSASPVEYVSIEEIRRRHPEETSEGGLKFLVEHMCFDIGKAEEMLGYSPKYSTEQGLAKALEWCLDQDLL